VRCACLASPGAPFCDNRPLKTFLPGPWSSQPLTTYGLQSNFATIQSVAQSPTATGSASSANSA